MRTEWRNALIKVIDRRRAKALQKRNKAVSEAIREGLRTGAVR